MKSGARHWAMRAAKSRALRLTCWWFRSAFSRFFSNPYIFAASAIVISLLLLAVYFSPLMAVLGTVSPNLSDWAVIAVSVILPVIIVEMTKLLGWLTRQDSPRQRMD